MTTATFTKDTSRIYVACQAAYNNGMLHGAWIEAREGAWAIWNQISFVLATSPIAEAEEWAIHDYEGFASIRIPEYEGIERIARIAALLEEHGSLGAELYHYFAGDLGEAVEAVNARYLGCYHRPADYMEEITRQSVSVPQNLAYYIDYEAMAQDAILSGTLFTIQTAEDEVHIFAG